jgi:hypothetical protein
MVFAYLLACQTGMLENLFFKIFSGQCYFFDFCYISYKLVLIGTHYFCSGVAWWCGLEVDLLWSFIDVIVFEVKGSP